MADSKKDFLNPEYTQAFIDSPFVQQMQKVTWNLYQHGWDERNGGNVSYRLTEQEVSQYGDVHEVKRNIPIKFDASELAGQYFLVTGTGRYFKNVKDFPESDTGLVRIAEDGHSVDLLWGFSDGGQPTSEFPAHLMTHIQRLKKDPNQRVVMHCHPTNTIAMTFTLPWKEKLFSRIFWKMQAESIVVFPEGVGVLPYMTPGTNEIGQATAEKMVTYRIVLWPLHGIFGAGDSIDETYGLIETIEKAATIYTAIQAQGGKFVNEITDENLEQLAQRFDLTPNPEFIHGDSLIKEKELVH
ncbi:MULTISPECIES: rhamnulose-1-phosphate aldolase [Lacticaseibacillus]|uniref:Rhamnulose-1-phosphate aldolase n=1 Tax=Lacticaseibacillus casei DSM 20011 = JCM 1134 = ATCC 393 TaxID=1423732 RepID=A0AAD1AQE9_LACCA|nr:rhamnulose-1-phosphate aldolase [Lacticaseibacillus casei]MBI6598190.1 rhamnulose-1-phosphate aldolase [Lacticaseibacillus casei]MBO1481869.1 rhamnulose-1-phosphate aldolase [Lacticaseibacillus casei]MBO2417149.1 rhamnulose-1-phosphate aldolase [Lacticaseibacillus casei]MCK2081541.1 rhamnulose-1-phosphate aldolase [Lacticaseibacillus casei]MDZ5496393.1 rhamnulose-1-phosphate aldolase [Lacticaseibacillus casei]